MEELRLLVEGLLRLVRRARTASDDVSTCVRKMGPMMLLPKVGLLAETLIWSSAKRQTGAARAVGHRDDLRTVAVRYLDGLRDLDRVARQLADYHDVALTDAAHLLPERRGRRGGRGARGIP